jgi:hypothetical protein
MRTKRRPDPAVEVLAGYAADNRGSGIAYARVTGARSRGLLRVGFRVGLSGALADRAAGYAALTAISRALCKRGFRNVRFILGDPDFVEEIASRRGIGEALALAYVRLRCALNSLATFDVRSGAADDLTQRARAEVALNLAA